MRQTKDIDDAVNDIVMVVVHQQKKRTILYSLVIILDIFIYVCYGGYRRATSCFLTMQPACSA